MSHPTCSWLSHPEATKYVRIGSLASGEAAVAAAAVAIAAAAILPQLLLVLHTSVG